VFLDHLWSNLSSREAVVLGIIAFLGRNHADPEGWLHFPHTYLP
jgi:hypothetical protein